jgi:hypothetical protein
MPDVTYNGTPSRPWMWEEYLTKEDAIKVLCLGKHYDPEVWVAVIILRGHHWDMTG